MRRIILNKLNELKSNPYYQVIRNPKIYLYNIGISTLIIGFISLIINILYIYTSLGKVKVPGGIHSLVGFVIALLLVFRTNTAYDRWWEGRKRITDIHNSVSFFISILNTCPNISDRKLIIKCLSGLISNLKKYLKDVTKLESDPEFHQVQMNIIKSIILILKQNYKQQNISEHELNLMRSSLKDLLDNTNACERIKNTPIPFAYYIHIKISIFIYIITLPFSMFQDLSLWSTPIVMILYFLISGIEIISNEIENPFSGEPNDLPIDNLIGSIEKLIK